MWTGRADVLFSSYVPLRAHPLYYLGIIFFAILLLVTLLRAEKSVANGVLGVITLLAIARTPLVPTL